MRPGFVPGRFWSIRHTRLCSRVLLVSFHELLVPTGPNSDNTETLLNMERHVICRRGMYSISSSLNLKWRCSSRPRAVQKRFMLTLAFAWPALSNSRIDVTRKGIVPGRSELRPLSSIYCGPNSLSKALRKAHRVVAALPRFVGAASSCHR